MYLLKTDSNNNRLTHHHPIPEYPDVLGEYLQQQQQRNDQETRTTHVKENKFEFNDINKNAARAARVRVARLDERRDERKLRRDDVTN